MTITLHLVRHAQGFHNLSTKNHSMPDPLLTPLGKSQCESLSQTFPTKTITHLIASPLRRTLYTALYSFPTFVTAGSKVIALPELQETSTLPCDTGSEPAALAEEFAGSVNLELVSEGWNSKTGRWDANAPAIEKRAREARIWLRDLGRKSEESGVSDVNIVVVTHGGFLHYLSDDWENTTLFVGTGWSNTEFRSYKFRDEEYTDTNASIEETIESRQRRKGSGKALSVEEQRNLKLAAENGWQMDGFQQKVLEGVEKGEGEERGKDVKEVEVFA